LMHGLHPKDNSFYVLNHPFLKLPREAFKTLLKKCQSLYAEVYTHFE
jgi:hypothetical protein